MGDRPHITAIIVTYNSRPFIGRCLDSLEEESRTLNMRILVIDNHSSDASAELAKGRRGVSVIERPTNDGFAAAVNAGLSLADSDYVLLLNPDTVVAPGAVMKMKEYLDLHRDVACVSPQLLNFDGSVQSSCREFPGLLTIAGEFLVWPRLRRRFPLLDRYRMGYFDHRSEREVDQPMASCMLLRTETLRDVGGLDESMPLFFNDVDLCRRMKDKNYRTVFFPDARVYHYQGASTRLLGARKDLELARSMYRYMRKHSSGGSSYLSGMLLVVGYLLKQTLSALTKTGRG